jgi:hypothetical protein
LWDCKARPVPEHGQVRPRLGAERCFRSAPDEGRLSRTRRHRWNAHCGGSDHAAARFIVHLRSFDQARQTSAGRIEALGAGTEIGPGADLCRSARKRNRHGWEVPELDQVMAVRAQLLAPVNTLRDPNAELEIPVFRRPRRKCRATPSLPPGRRHPEPDHGAHRNRHDGERPAMR